MHYALRLIESWYTYFQFKLAPFPWILDHIKVKVKPQYCSIFGCVVCRMRIKNWTLPIKILKIIFCLQIFSVIQFLRRVIKSRCCNDLTTRPSYYRYFIVTSTRHRISQDQRTLSCSFLDYWLRRISQYSTWIVEFKVPWELPIYIRF
jgi:hypothetical protein